MCECEQEAEFKDIFISFVHKWETWIEHLLFYIDEDVRPLGLT
jgi:hypothetical protein